MKYPIGTKKGQGQSKLPTPYHQEKQQKRSSLANRGKGLEQLIEAANDWYYIRNHAAIQKVPTPMKNVRIGGEQRAIYEKKSTVDFIGTAPGGRSIAFEAKSTRLKTRFKFDLIEDHQWNWLESVHELGGHAFFIIEFSTINRICFLPFHQARSWKKEGAASIPLHFFILDCTPNGTNPLDYLEHLRWTYREKE